MVGGRSQASRGAGGRRALGRLVAVVLLVAASAACAGQGPGAAAPSVVAVAPADGITIDNATGSTVAVVYERPDGSTEPVFDLPDGSHLVFGDLFVGRDGLCRTGRLVAMLAGQEVDELYLVCKGQAWTIEADS
jgi:hypothetical protein